MGRANFFKAYFEGGRAQFFFNALFLLFLHGSYITRIITGVGAQQKHKGMILKHGGRGGGLDFFPRVFFGRQGGGGGGEGVLFFTYRFSQNTINPGHK